MNREKIYFSIPAKAEFLSVIRLTTSAIGSKMNFDIEAKIVKPKVLLKKIFGTYTKREN